MDNPQVTKARDFWTKKNRRISYNFINSFVYRYKMKYYNIQFINLTYALSNFFGTRKFSNHINKTNKLNPYFITGFVDGEGHFGMDVYKDSKRKTG